MLASPRFSSRAGVTPEISLREATRQQLEARRRERRGGRMSFMKWALMVPEPKAGTLNFDAFPFQRELYAEGSDDRETVVKKSTQVGITAWAVRWLIYHADLRGMTGLYVFPTLSDVYDLADARIKPLTESRYLASRILPDDPANKGLKKIGLGLCYFRGSESKRKLDSVDADHLVLDEYDTLAQDNIPDAEMRLSSPLSKGLIRRLGVPSIPGWGIAKSYDGSDQRRWHVKCGGCNEYQPITFDANVDQDRCLIVCRVCRKPLDVRNGEWVAAFPERSVRGYHITRLMAPTIDVAKIVEQSKKRNPTERQVFFNKHLGEEYAPAEGRLSEQAIAAAQRDYVTVEGDASGGLVTMGIDVASTRALNVRISKWSEDGSKIALCLTEVDSFNDLPLLMARFNVKMAAIDHLPDGRLARSFAERFPGRVFVVAYETTQTPKDPRVLKVDESMMFATVRRTEAMDATAEAIRAQTNLLPQDLPEGYVAAMQAPVRVSTEDELGRRHVGYKSMGADDWFHAEVYDTVAFALMEYRLHRDEQDADVFTKLEDMLEFERSNLADPDAEAVYTPGGRDDEYYEGGADGY